MKSLVDDEYIEEFKALLSKPGRQENAIQAFLEQHTTFLPTPGLLNHRLHLNSVISKFPIGDRIADYAYLTKSSDEWKLVLVELEDAGKKLFTQSSKHVGFTAEMNDAIAQVDVWREFWNENRRTVLNSLEHLLVPPGMRRNAVSLECVLVIGRSAEKDSNEARRKRLAALRADKQIQVMTYDTILRAVGAGFGEARAILTKTGSGFRLRSVEGLPSNLFTYLLPEHLSVDPDVEATLRAEGYDMDAWLANYPLIVNEKWPDKGAWKRAEEAGMHPNVVRLLKSSEERRRGSASAT